MKFVQFNPKFHPDALGAPLGEWDNSHQVSAISADGARTRAAEFKHAEWARLFCEMMNAREGQSDGNS